MASSSAGLNLTRASDTSELNSLSSMRGRTLFGFLALVMYIAMLRITWCNFRPASITRLAFQR
jgi:hypothetical protein